MTKIAKEVECQAGVKHKVNFSPIGGGWQQTTAGAVTFEGEYMFDVIFGDDPQRVVDAVVGVVVQCARCVGCDGRKCDFSNNVYWGYGEGKKKVLESRASKKK